MQVGAERAKKSVRSVYIFRLSFHFCLPSVVVGEEEEAEIRLGTKMCDASSSLSPRKSQKKFTFFSSSSSSPSFSVLIWGAINLAGGQGEREREREMRGRFRHQDRAQEEEEEEPDRRGCLTGVLPTQPPTGGMQNGKLSRNTHTSRARFFARWGADLHARSVLINKNFCVRSSIGSLLGVRCWLGQ